MQTPLHARPKAYRNLYNARRVTNRGKTDATMDKEFTRETVRMVDEGWKAFWKKRGINKPPYVSDRQICVFDTL